MKGFKTDENLPIELTHILQNAGHDALTIHDQLLVGNPDFKIATVCQEEKRTLITLDLDFADIRSYPPHLHPGIIVLRPRTQSKQVVIELLMSIMHMFELEPIEGKLWIVQENGIRIRE